MKIRDKKGFITIYVMLAMIFLITIITLSLITVSRKRINQTQINSEIYRMYNQGDFSDRIVDYTTEIPIYTKEQFECLRDWIKNEDRKTEFMLINGNLYKLDSDKYEEYKAILRTDLYLECEFDKSEFEVIKNDFEIIDYYVAYVYNINSDNKWSNPIYKEKEIPEGEFCFKFYKRDNSKIEESNIIYYEYGTKIELPVESSDYSYKLVIDGTGDMPSCIGTNGAYIGYQTGINNIFAGGTVKDNLIMAYVDEIVIKEGITSIGAGAFLATKQITSLNQITMPESVTKFDNFAFAASGLEELEIPDQIKEIGINTFYSSTFIEKVIIPGTLETISTNAFQYCTSLTNLKILEGVEKIENKSFEHCYLLKTVVIPKSITFLGEEAFSDNKELSEIFIEIEDINKVQIEAHVFEGAKDSAKIYIRTADFEQLKSGINTPVVEVGYDWTAPIL